MVSDDERREVAASLRMLADGSGWGGGVYNDDVLDALGMRRGRVNWLTTPESVRRLADLIDGQADGEGRPTCPECGGSLGAGREAAGSPYCPYCGTKVVHDGC